MNARYLQHILILAGVTALIGACSNVVDPVTGLPPRKQYDGGETAMAGPVRNMETHAAAEESSAHAGQAGAAELVVTAKLNHLKRENIALQNSQQKLVAQIDALNAQMARDREDRQRFRNMMATNFELLEQMVERDMVRRNRQGLVAANDVEEEKVEIAPPTRRRVEPIAGPAQISPPAERQRPRAIELPAGPAADGRDALRPLPATGDMPASSGWDITEADYAGEDMAAPMPLLAADRRSKPIDDPDLIPPANPMILRAIPAAKPLYEKGFVYYAKGQYEKSIEVYREFLSRFPDDNHSDNAQFWIGEANFRMQRYRESEAAYRAVLRIYDHRSTLEGFKAPDSIYRLGHIYLNKGKTDQAEYYFTNVARRFPQSTAGQKAQRELDAIRLDTAAGGIHRSGPDT